MFKKSRVVFNLTVPDSCSKDVGQVDAVTPIISHVRQNDLQPSARSIFKQRRFADVTNYLGILFLPQVRVQ